MTPAGLVDFNNIVSGLFGQSREHQYLMLGALFFFLAYAVIKRSSAGLFFLLASHCSLLAISISTSVLANRYYCLPLMYWACFVSLFFRDIAAAIAKVFEKVQAAWLDSSRKGPDVSRWIFVIVHASACLALAFAGLRGNLERRAYWKLASAIEQNIVQTVEYMHVSGFGRGRPGQKIYLLDIPNHLWSEEYSVFFVAGNCIMPDIRHRLGRDAERVELIASTDIRWMTSGEERLAYRIKEQENIMSKSDIEGLIEEGHLVLQFMPHALNLVPLNPKE